MKNYDRLLELLEGKDTEFLAVAIGNWMDNSELDEFIEFIEQELEDEG